MDEQEKKQTGADRLDLQGPKIVEAEPAAAAASATDESGSSSIAVEDRLDVSSDEHGIKQRIQAYKQSKTRDAAAQAPRGESKSRDGSSQAAATAIPKFPNLWAGTVLVLVFSIFINYMVGVQTDSLLKHLPMQIFWTSCVFRLFQISDLLYGKTTKPAGVALLSLLAFLFSPSFPAAMFISRFFDPFFLVWVTSQCVAPWIIGRRIDEADSSKRSQNRFKLPVLGNWYLLLAILLPVLLNDPRFFNFFWCFCQFSWLISANQMLQKQLSKKNVKSAAADDRNLKEIAFVAGEELELRYRAFAGLERWMAQRLSSQKMKQGVKQFLMWVVGPALVIVGVMLTKVLWGTAMSNTAAEAAAASQAGESAASVQLYLIGFILFLFGIIVGARQLYRSKPTHLLLSPEGLRFAWKHKGAKPRYGKLLSWSGIKHISIEKPQGETSTLRDALAFQRSDESKLTVKLDSFDSFEDKEWILKAIKAWAPHVSRDAAVLQSLQPPADYSYTELWLQALSAPPQRERLKPLVPGVALKQGKYLVKNSLGVGGQGQAYLASDALSGEELVLKEFILPVFVDISVRKSALEQFENEARILRQLDHGQIVKLIDYFVEDHRAYLVLEHIDGASLRELVEKQGALPEGQVRALAKQMAAILSYLHNLAPPVVHRDFTPDNLILNVDGTLKLIDFNVAQQQESTTSGTVVGKHAYLPPEQFRGMPTSQSDIYAMGATLFFLLTGNDPEPISQAHPGKENEQISASMDKLVANATAISLQKRYGRVEDLLADL